MFLVICEFPHEQLTQSKFQNNKSHPQMQASNARVHTMIKKIIHSRIKNNYAIKKLRNKEVNDELFCGLTGWRDVNHLFQATPK